jgi:hypothetical protein
MEKPVDIEFLELILKMTEKRIPSDFGGVMKAQAERIRIEIQEAREAQNLPKNPKNSKIIPKNPKSKRKSKKRG